MLYSVLARKFPFALVAPQSDLIIGTGHGLADLYSAQNESVIWKVGQYDAGQVRGKVIKLVSCFTAARLGPDLVNKGAACFMGYDEDYTWIMDVGKAATPWADDVAAEVLMPMVNSLNALLDGKTTGEAFQIELDGYARNAQAEAHGLIRSCIEFNAAHAVLLGDPQARIRARPALTAPFKMFPPPPLPPVVLGL